MSTWGDGVFDNDLAMDVLNLWDELIAAGTSPFMIREAVGRQMGGYLAMKDPEPREQILRALGNLDP